MDREESIAWATGLRRVAGAAGLIALMALGGCAGGDGVQLNGKVFDVLGSAFGSSGANEDAKIAPRAGLIVPPGLENLPPPGTSSSVPDGDLAQIKDFDTAKVVDKSALEAKQREYCKVNYEQAKTRGDSTADMATGPMGPCRPSAMGMISSINGEKK